LKLAIASLSAAAVQSKSIVDIVANSTDHTTLAAIVTDAQYADILSALGGDNLTLFAPTDEAFASDVTIDPFNATFVDAVKAILKYHVIPSVVPSSALTTLQFPQSFGGPNIRVESNAGVVLNERVNVTGPDNEADNGIVHIIDGVIMPPQSPSATAVAASFDILVAALGKADLVATLDGLTDVTIFAPTDDAFAASNITSVDGLTKEVLDQVLKYHLIPSRVFSVDLANGDVDTVQGDPVTINIDDGVKVNTATVTTADVLVSNGVIHIIDAVLFPPAEVTTTTTGADATTTTADAGGNGTTTGGADDTTAQPSHATMPAVGFLSLCLTTLL